MASMLEYIKIILQKVSFDRRLFEKELKKRQKNSNQIIQSNLEKEYESKLSQKALEVKELHANK